MCRQLINNLVLCSCSQAQFEKEMGKLGKASIKMNTVDELNKFIGADFAGQYFPIKTIVLI